MFHVKNHKQLNIIDPWEHLGPKRRKTLEKSWAGLFRKKILPKLPVKSLRKHYHNSFGRPTHELYSMIGMIILQQMHDLTDNEAVEQFSFNIKWHYALNITGSSDKYSYICPKTLWTMRDLLTREGLHEKLFKDTLKILAKIFKVDLKKQRMDSVHITSNMRHLGRISLFSRTIRKFLTNLKRHHQQLFNSLDNALVKRYLCKQENALFSIVKPSESGKTLNQLARDVFTLTEKFASIEKVRSMSSFKLLVRLFQEQCVIEKDQKGMPIKAEAKPNNEVASDSLQNPSDPDAGYSGHKGKGYQVQVVENYDDDQERDQRQLSLLTHIALESASEHDANALMPALDDLKQSDMLPEKMLGDSLYGSDDNCDEAMKKYGVELIAPTMNGNQKGLSLADFKVSDQEMVEACPEGIAPIRVKKNKTNYSAAFSSDKCGNCKRSVECPVAQGKKAYYLRYTKKDVRLASRRRFEQTPAFKDNYRFRAGVEATMSEFDRRTGVKHLRVRGRKAVAFAVMMKAIGLNILRASAYKNRPSMPSGQPKPPLCGTQRLFLRLYCHVKEQLRLNDLKIINLVNQLLPNLQIWVKLPI